MHDYLHNSNTTLTDYSISSLRDFITQTYFVILPIFCAYGTIFIPCRGIKQLEIQQHIRPIESRKDGIYFKIVICQSRTNLIKDRQSQYKSLISLIKGCGFKYK